MYAQQLQKPSNCMNNEMMLDGSLDVIIVVLEGGTRPLRRDVAGYRGKKREQHQYYSIILGGGRGGEGKSTEGG